MPSKTSKMKKDCSSKNESSISKYIAEQASALLENLENSSDNSRLSISGRKRSLYLSDESGLETVANNDLIEKKERRKAEAIEREKTKTKNKVLGEVKQAENHLVKLSAEELDNHYSRCMTLHSQNKVNAKNAFKLQLIDYMKMTLTNKTEKSENLMLMGCTLDASAKIYSCRVDKVYMDMVKFLSGKDYSKEKDKQEGNENSEADDNDDDDSNDVDKFRKKVGDFNEDEDSSLSFFTKFNQQFQFIKASDSFERKEIDQVFYLANLPWNQEHFLSCPVSKCDYQLALNRPIFEDDSDSPRAHPFLTTLGPEYCGGRDEDNLKEYIPGYAEWIRNSENRQESYENLHQAENSLTYDPKYITIAQSSRVDTNLEGSGDDDDKLEDDQREVVEVDYDEDELMGVGESVGASSNKLLLNSLSTSKRSSIKDISFTPVAMKSKLKHHSLTLSDYSFFDESKLEFMAGPSHWKFNHRKGKVNENVKTPYKSKKTQFCDYSSDVIMNHCSDILGKDSDSKKLSTKTIKEWYFNKEKNTLPKDISYTPKKLHSYFKVEAFFSMRSSNLLSPLNELEQSAIFTPDDFIDTGDHQEDDCDDNEIFAPPISVSNVENESGTPDNSGNQMFSENNLLSAPNKVGKSTVNFVRKQKQIDIKKLKAAIWNELDLERNKENVTKVNNGPESTEVTFSSVYSNLPHSLPEEMSSELTMPTAFMCLLFLANEKCLHLETSKERTDVTVSLDNS